MKSEYLSKLPSALFPIRLNKYISFSGYCSRRKADDFIKDGYVSVDGKIIKEPGFIVLSSKSIVTVNKTILSLVLKNIYILLNKPKDYISTTQDERGRKTVMELIKFHDMPRLYPVGRLDRNTTGVLLLTNDGDLSHFLTHPSSNILKEYYVRIDRHITEQDFNKLLSGVDVEGTIFKASKVLLADNNPTEIIISVHYGRYHIVRKMFKTLEYDIVSLDRIGFAGLTKRKLKRGEWRFLTTSEITYLKNMMKKKKK